MAIRDINYLIQLYPDKTGRELKELQEQDRVEEEKRLSKLNTDKLAFVEDINKNGGYYKGTFGLDQKFYYRVFNAKLVSDGTIYFDVEQLVLMANIDGHKGTIMEPGRATLERRISTFQDYDTYGFNSYDRVTEKEWNKINDYLNKMVELFW